LGESRNRDQQSGGSQQGGSETLRVHWNLQVGVTGITPYGCGHNFKQPFDLGKNACRDPEFFCEDLGGVWNSSIGAVIETYSSATNG
jgi:hypothetical protein